MKTSLSLLAMSVSYALLSQSITANSLSNHEHDSTEWNGEWSNSSVQVTGQQWSQTPVSPGGSGSGGPSGAGGSSGQAGSSRPVSREQALAYRATCLAENIAHHLTGIPGTTCQPTPARNAQASQNDQAGGLVTITDVQTMLINTSTIDTQPPGGHALINYLCDTPPQTMTTTILNQPVTIHAWPVSWTWNTGDGTTFTTHQPGTGWPDSPIHHTYTTPGTITITLTVTWHATYTLNGTTHPIDGTAITTTTHTLTLHQAESILTN